MPKQQRDADSTLEPSGRLLEAHLTLSTAIERLAVAPTGYSPTVLDLLVRLALAEGQALRGVDLVDQMYKSPGYISRVIDEAESQGLVKRQPDPDDRRAQRVEPTDKGKSVLEEFLPRVTEVVDQAIFGTLDADEVGTLNELLARITASSRALLDR